MKQTLLVKYSVGDLLIFSDFLRLVFSASRVQHVSDLHLKFALRLHYVHGSMTDIQSATAEIRRGKKDRTRMWANVQRNGRPAKYRWRPLFNAAKFG